MRVKWKKIFKVGAVTRSADEVGVAEPRELRSLLFCLREHNLFHYFCFLEEKEKGIVGTKSE